MFLIVYTTVKNRRDADKISDTLIKEKLAACVNYFPIMSVYKWKNRVEKTSEFMLMCKTTKNNLKKLKKRMNEVHPYKLPELIAVPISDGDKRFLDWIQNSAP